MQIKTIEKIIKDKMNEWLKTISDDSLRKEIRENLLVSGGSIASMLLNEKVNDFDVYFMNMDTVLKVTRYYAKKSFGVQILDGRHKQSLIDAYNKSYEYSDSNDKKSAIEKNASYAVSLRNLKEDQIKLYFDGGQAGLKVNEDKKEDELNYTPLFFSPNAISLSNDLQIVLRFWGTAEQVHKTFDFVHATNYFTFKEGFVRNLAAMESIITKQLKYQGSYYPVTSVIRAKKFVKRGFNIGAGELLKIMFQISQLDLSNPDTLEEQLIGVDVAYFDLLITALRNKAESDEHFKISTDYFNTLIDKIFNESQSEN